MSAVVPADLAGLDDAALALALARAAGSELLRVRGEHARLGSDARTIKDAGDAASQALLSRLLAGTRPQDAVLSEEAPDDPARLAARRVWIIDPLDGTREFAEDGRKDWAVHVALWQDGDLTAAAVTLPAAGLGFATGGLGDPVPTRTERSGPVRLAVSRSRPPAFVSALAEQLGADLVPMGSAGAKALSVLRDQSDAYVHAGGQYEWDSAAPVAVVRAAGLFTSRVDGSPLEYNRPNPTLPDVVVARPDLAQLILQGVRQVS